MKVNVDALVGHVHKNGKINFVVLSLCMAIVREIWEETRMVEFGIKFDTVYQHFIHVSSLSTLLCQS